VLYLYASVSEEHAATSFGVVRCRILLGCARLGRGSGQRAQQIEQSGVLTTISDVASGLEKVTDFVDHYSNTHDNNQFSMKRRGTRRLSVPGF
jgi:hypothetical protein